MQIYTEAASVLEMWIAARGGHLFALLISPFASAGCMAALLAALLRTAQNNTSIVWGGRHRS